MMQPSKAPAVTGEWECTECGNVVEGVELRRPAQCPTCGAPADVLEFYANEEDDELEELEDEEDDIFGADDSDEEDEDVYDDLDGGEFEDDEEEY